MKDLSVAKEAAGYQHRADDEFIFGVNDPQDIFDHLFDIYTENRTLAIRNSGVKNKNKIIRTELLKKMGKPIADTDHDFCSRTPYWGDAFTAGTMVTRTPVEHKDSLPNLVDITSCCKPENRLSKITGGTYVREVYHFPGCPHTEALAATLGRDGVKAEKGFVILPIADRTFRIYRDMNYRP